MSIRCASLGSGSKGNATLIASQSTCILVDCGFGLKETLRRLHDKNIQPQEIDAILVTHEHGDHAGGVARLSKKFDIPVWLTRGSSLHSSLYDVSNYHYIEAEVPVFIGDIEVFPFTVPHDAREPVQFLFSSQQVKVGLLTDTGHVTTHIGEVISQCQLLLLEFNHNLMKLQQSTKYPPSVKQRIAGDFGHLSNDQAMRLLSEMSLDNLRMIVAMHLSEENNCPVEVSECLKSIVNGSQIDFQIAGQEKGFDWIELSL